MKDMDDIHVASAAGYLAEKLVRSVILVTENLADLPQALLTPLNTVLMHPGTLLEWLYNKSPKAVATSLLKTAADFRNPPIPPVKLVWSIESRNQFYNPELAKRLAKDWDVPYTTCNARLL
ncbi:MAG: hypothetical protein IT507_14085 [Burkholderiaceae bacterium]|nr:hypothetical protein [Burkholderiaceae bacterium]